MTVRRRTLLVLAIGVSALVAAVIGPLAALRLDGVVLAFAALAAGVLTAAVVVALLRPLVFARLERLGEEVRRVTVDRDARVSAPGHDEIAEVAAVLNGALDSARDAARRRDECESAIRRDARRLQEARRLETVGRLAGAVAHDHNNLLAVVVGRAELLAADLGEQHPARADVDAIGDAARRAAALTHHVLAAGRSGATPPQVVDVAAHFAQLQPYFRRIAGDRVTVEVVLAPGLPNVMLDVSRLTQTVVGLVASAREVLPLGGTVVLGSSIVDAPASALRVEVTLRGDAIDPDSVARAKPCDECVADMESARSATLRVEVPLARETVPAVTGGDDSDDAANLVLVVDDNAALRSIARRALQSGGFSVLECGSAEEALAVASGARSLQCVVTDVVLPGMRGPELARRLWAARPGLPVVLVSGRGDDAEAQEAVAAGASFLAKPFSPFSLVDVVRVRVQAAAHAHSVA